MDHTRQSRSEHTDWLRKGPLAPHLNAYLRHLTERGYAPRTIVSYLACLAHSRNGHTVDDNRSAGSTKLSSRHSLTSTCPAATAQGPCGAVGHIYALHWVMCLSFGVPSASRTSGQFVRCRWTRNCIALTSTWTTLGVWPLGRAARRCTSCDGC